MKNSFPSNDSDEMPQAIELVLQRWISTRDRQELATSITHDLVQPLSEIVNRVWLCRDSYMRSEDMDQLLESLDEIENCALRAVELVRLAHKLIGAEVGSKSLRDRGESGDTVS